MSSFTGPAYLQPFIDEQWVRVVVVRGNTATCNLQGWLYQVGVGGPLYIACLSFYFYLAICHQKRDRDVLKWIEPAMHLVVWTWGIVTASLAIGMDLIVLIGSGGCRVSSASDFSARCEFDPTFPECQKSLDLGAWLLFCFILPPLCLASVFIVVCMTLIYCKVRKVEKKAKKWRFEFVLQKGRREKSPVTMPYTAGATAVSISSGHEYIVPLDDKIGKNSKGMAASIDESVSSGTGAAAQSNVMIAMNRGGSGPSSVGSSCESSGSSGESACSGESGSSFEDEDDVKRKRKRKRRKKGSTDLSDKVKETGAQYIVGFVFSYAITIINISNSKPDPLLMLLLGGITLPSQGIWNFAFYTRGRMKVIREKKPNHPWRKALYEAVFD